MSSEIMKYKSVAFFIILVFITGMFLYTVRPLLLPIFYGAVFATVLYPLSDTLRRKLKFPASLAVAFSIVAAIVVLAGVIYLLGAFVVKDAITLIDNIGNKAELLAPQAVSFQENLRQILPEAAAERLSEINLRGQFVNLVKNFAENLIQGIRGISASFLQILALSLVAFYATFYFLRNGREWFGHIKRVLPLPPEEEDYLGSHFLAMARVALKMVFVMGAVQGFLGGLIFAILGITAPFFWGFVFAVFSLIPGLGHFLLWVPTAIILIVTGSAAQGIILILYGVLVMGLSDDLLRPYLIGRKVEIHPFLILISTIGGIAAFGFTGLLLGPIVASLTLAVWELYEKKYAGN